MAPGRCPRCGCAETVSKGRDADGSPRRLCRGCGETYGAKTGSVLAMSKLPAGTWMMYAQCMVDGVKLREAAGRCGVSLKTSWFMRMRLCEAMAGRIAPFRCPEGLRCEIDGTYLAESMKGDRQRQGGAGIPRKARRHGHSSHRRGLSGELVCVVCGANDLGDAFCRLVSRGQPTDAQVAAALAGRVRPGSTARTDGKGCYARVLPAMGAGVDAHPGEVGALPLVNALHSELDRFLAPFCGVSTKRLQRYLDWFLYARQVARRGCDKKEAYWDDARSARYSQTWRGYLHQPDPFPGYWENKAI